MGIITGLHHVSMKCQKSQYGEVVHFYRDLLGLPIVRSWDTGVMFDAGNGIVEVFTNGIATYEDGSIRHFSLKTNDVDACVRIVKAAGYTVLKEPGDIVLPSETPYSIRMAFCRGPINEVIEFLQEK